IAFFTSSSCGLPILINWTFIQLKMQFYQSFRTFHSLTANNFVLLMKLKPLYLFIIVLLFSCEKTINLKVNNQPAKLVVDASIENDQTPIVVLSSSLNYFSNITPDELSASFVHD